MYFPQYASLFKEWILSLKDKKVVVLGHLRPDGDCIGAQVALARILRGFEVQATVIVDDVLPHNLVNFIKDTPFSQRRDYLFSNEIVITVDCASPERLGNYLQNHFAQFYLNIDHHVSNQQFAQNNIVIDNAAATCEILAGLAFDNDIALDTVAANALYLGIVTDTGQFQHESTTAQIFDIANKLVTTGASPSLIAHEVYSNEPLRKWKLLKEFLETLTLELDGQLCVGFISQEMYQKTGALKEDIEGFVDYARAIQGVKIGALLEERQDGGVKGSLRAETAECRLDELAAQFNGGGHHCAAGLRADEPLSIFYPKFLAAAKAHLNKIITS